MLYQNIRPPTPINSRAAKVENRCDASTRALASGAKEDRLVCPPAIGQSGSPVTYTSARLFSSAQECAHSLPQAQPHPRNQSLCLSGSHLRTKFLAAAKLKQKQAPSERRKTRVQMSRAVEARRRACTKGRKDTRPTGGLKEGDATRAQHCQGDHSLGAHSRCCSRRRPHGLAAGVPVCAVFIRHTERAGRGDFWEV